MRLALGLLLVAATAIPGTAQTRLRGRDLGIPFPGRTGPLNAITDVAGIAVGHVTLIEGDGKLVPGNRATHVVGEARAVLLYGCAISGQQCCLHGGLASKTGLRV